MRPLPAAGSVFFDARGDGRALRVSWHSETDMVVLSLWRDNLCVGSFRLAADEVPDLVDLLRRGRDPAYDDEAAVDSVAEAPRRRISSV